MQNNIRYELRDCCWGRVIGRHAKGVFIELDNREIAFAYGGFPNGSRVLCTVRRLPRDLYDRMLVGIDSVVA